MITEGVCRLTNLEDGESGDCSTFYTRVGPTAALHESSTNQHQNNHLDSEPPLQTCAVNAAKGLLYVGLPQTSKLWAATIEFGVLWASL